MFQALSVFDPHPAVLGSPSVEVGGLRGAGRANSDTAMPASLLEEPDDLLGGGATIAQVRPL